jgi:hypothetical protein
MYHRSRRNLEPAFRRRQSGPRNKTKDRGLYLLSISPCFLCRPTAMATWKISESNSSTPTAQPPFKVYKRRFWGLAQLVLLNIVVSWDVCFTGPGSTPRSEDSVLILVVAHLLIHLNHRRGVLPCLRECYQLVKHRLFVRILCRQSVSDASP